jgi:hypothetical protein
MTEIPDEIRERLEAAERVCLLVGWTPSRRDTTNDIALTMMWRRWFHAYGKEIDEGIGSLGLDDDTINDLARQQQEIEMLERTRMLPDTKEH